MRAAAHAPAQLVQLRQTKALGVLDDHQGGVGHVNSHLDYRGADQNLDFSLFEALHDGAFFIGSHAAVQQSNFEFPQ